MVTRKGHTPTLRRALLGERLRSALGSSGTALTLAVTLVGAALAYVLGSRGFLRPEAWMAGLAAGGLVTGAKVAADLALSLAEPDQLRRALLRVFGPDMARDKEVSRLARQIVEFRVRLTEAAPAASPAAKRALAAQLPALDRLVDALAGLARAVVAQKDAAGFHTGLAGYARHRLGDVNRKAAAAVNSSAAMGLKRAAGGLAQQVAASENLARHIDDGLLRLEHATASFGAITSDAVLALSRGDAAAFSALGQRVADSLGQLDAPSGDQSEPRTWPVSAGEQTAETDQRNNQPQALDAARPVP